VLILTDITVGHPVKAYDLISLSAVAGLLIAS